MVKVTYGTREPRAFTLLNYYQGQHSFWKDDVEMEDVLQASKASDAHSFVSQLPQGYDTQVRNSTCIELLILY